MAFDRTKTIIGYNKRLAYAATSGGSYTTVDGTIDVSLPERELGKAEITNDATASYTKDYIPGMFEPGAIKFTYKYTRTMFGTLESVFQFAATTPASAQQYWKVTLPDGSTAITPGFLIKHTLPLDLDNSPVVEGEIQTTGPMVWVSGS